MAEYIEKNKAIKELYEVYDYEFPTASGGFDEYARMIVPNTIKNMPAADVAPVVHGHWIEQEDGNLDTYYTCSSCKEDFDLIAGTPCENLYNYCPSCGAKMDEKEDR